MCGVFGYVAKKWNEELASFFALMGFFLQHRGQENCGAAFSNGDYIEDIIKGYGLVSTVFNDKFLKSFRDFQPLIATGHTRYATAGSKSMRCAQPQWMDFLEGRRVVCSNGDLPLLDQERKCLEDKEVFLLSSRNRQGEIVMPNDAEIILKKISLLAEENGRNFTKAIRDFMLTTKGAYSTALTFHDKLYLFRDPYGFRPLVYGYWKNSWVFASESCAFHESEAKVEGEVKPGELIIFTLDGKIKKHQLVEPKRPGQRCPFEWIYFSRPDSRLFGIGEKEFFAFRYELGRKLYQEQPLEEGIVVGVPNSGIPAAKGFARGGNLNDKVLFVHTPYITRTFIEKEGHRERKSRLKYSLMPSLLSSLIGKIQTRQIKTPVKIIIVDDSIVRLTTLKVLVSMVIEEWSNLGGQKKDLEIHTRIPSPMIKAPCYYGIDTPTYDELIAANHSEKEIAQILGAASVRYLSIKGLNETLDNFARPFNQERNFCNACFTDRYPTEVEPRV
ncbi:MAG: amidophosphoribosyltransferase [Patescibacteria group bacterium]|nr:amidophosphoribosyltransferase [Patescibacteria group bacterium]